MSDSKKPTLSEIVALLSNAVPGYHEAICPHPEEACTCSMKPQVELMAPVVERLLAEERERVREMCANAAIQPAGELRDLLKTIEEFCGPGDVDAETERLRMENRAEELELVADAIRQLDLTKDLAPSKEEEKG